MATKKLITGFARFISAVTSPFLMPSYAAFGVLWTSVLCTETPGTKYTVLAMIVGITCVLPATMVSVLHHFKLIRDKRLESRRERTVPYLFSMLCLVGAAFYLNHIHSPLWFTTAMASAAFTCAVMCAVNLKWMVSSHMAGLGGLLTIAYELHIMGLEAFNLFWVVCVLVLLAGVVGTARIVMGRHNFAEVLAGFAIGAGGVWLGYAVYQAYR